MAQQQIDITPTTQLGSGAQNTNGIHFHAPNGHSASEFNDPASFPSVAANAADAKAVSTKITATPGTLVKFSNPA